MHVVVYHAKSYKWVPLPREVSFTHADVAGGKVRLDLHGNPRVREVHDGETHTMVTIDEQTIVEKIIHDKCRPEGGRTLSRKEAVAFILSEHFAPEHFHRSWLTGRFEFHDDGPDEKIARELLQVHVEAGNIPADHLEDHVRKYMEPTVHEDHAAHLKKHFKLKDKVKS